MNILVAFLAFVIVVALGWWIISLVPLPPVLKNIILAVGALFLLIYVLKFLPGLNLSL